MSDNESNNYGSDGETEVDPRAHKRLLAGVNSLRTTQFIKKATRSEPSLKRDEFHLLKPGKSEETKSTKIRRKTEINIEDLAKVFDKSNKQLQLGKAIRKTAVQKNVLPKPLEKPASEKLQRVINYEKAVEKLDEWDSIVARNQSTDHMVKLKRLQVFFCHSIADLVFTFNFYFDTVVSAQPREVHPENSRVCSSAIKVPHQV